MIEALGGPGWAMFLLVEWTIRLTMLVVVPFRRSPEAAKGWLLLILFLPLPGLLLYLAIGRPHFPLWRRERFAKIPQLMERAASAIAHSAACKPPDLPDNLKPAATLTQNLGRFPSLAGNRICLLTCYEETVDRIAADIRAAQRHVHLLMYIFMDDQTGEKVIEALTDAARRGVDCRVLVDALGSRAAAARLSARLRPAGVQFQTALDVNIWRRSVTRADLRNHRKLIIIDNEVGYIGSQNIVDRGNDGLANQELVARVAGPLVMQLQAVFAADWFLETEEILHQETVFEHRRPPEGANGQVLPSGPDYANLGIARLLVSLIHGARRKVVIASPYFIPDEPLVQALTTAVLRGLDVKLFLSRRADHRLVNLAQRSYYAELLAAGVNIFLYERGFLHAKHVSIDDDVAIVGSSNIDIRSFVLNAEVSLIAFDAPLVAKLREIEVSYETASIKLARAKWRRRGFMTKSLENLARLLSPLL